MSHLTFLFTVSLFSGFLYLLSYGVSDYFARFTLWVVNPAEPAPILNPVDLSPLWEEDSLDPTPNPAPFSPPAVALVPQLSRLPMWDGLEEMSSARLKNLAKRRKIKGYGSMKKAQLIAALRAA